MLRFFKIITIAIIFITTSSLAAIAYENKTAKADLPVNTNMGCSKTIDEVKSDLTKKHFFVPWSQTFSKTTRSGNPEVIIDKKGFKSSHYGYPEDRTDEVIFVLGEVRDLYNSPKYMATISAQIMAECSQVGLVSFQWWFEGHIPVGYFPDNTARVFKWLHPDFKSDHIKIIQTANGTRSYLFEWGYFFSP